MENIEYYNLGFKLGEKCKNNRGALSNLILIATSNSKNYEMIQNKLINICSRNSEPIPDFTVNLNAENYSSLIAFLTGANNGSLSK